MKVKTILYCNPFCFVGFGPGTSNVSRKMLGMDEVAWREMEQARLFE